MFAIIGILIVIGAIIGGYLMEHGNLQVLVQPAELVIIGGAAAGTLLIANPLPTVIGIFQGILGVMKGSRCNKAFYLETLKMLNEVFSYARKNSMAKLEPDVEEPDKSQLFAKFPKFVKDHHALYFFCDTLRILITGGVATHDLNDMMELDMEVHHHQASAPVAALSSMADSLPGLGIVAAVLGVVITMGAIGGPPEEIGHKVAAALVGTFLGILLAYGFVGPLATVLEQKLQEESKMLDCIKVTLLASLNGYAPALAVEFGRKVLYSTERPGFLELEAHVKGRK